MNLLVIEDNFVLCEIIKNFFSGHAVDIAESYQEAMNNVSLVAYDKIIIDIVLPGTKTGYDFAIDYRKINKHVEMIGITGLDENTLNIIKRNYPENINDIFDKFLDKPLDMALLEESMDINTCTRHAKSLESITATINDIRKDTKDNKEMNNTIYIALVGDIDTKGHITKTDERFAELDNELSDLKKGQKSVGKILWFTSSAVVTIIVGVVVAIVQNLLK